MPCCPILFSARTQWGYDSTQTGTPVGVLKGMAGCLHALKGTQEPLWQGAASEASLTALPRKHGPQKLPHGTAGIEQACTKPGHPCTEMTHRSKFGQDEQPDLVGDTPVHGRGAGHR